MLWLSLIFLDHGLLNFKIVYANTAVQQQLIEALHSSSVGAHSGIPATVKCVQQHFAWTGMKKHIADFVKRCATYLDAKLERVKYLGLLQPLVTPSSACGVNFFI
jgi:hypothetical protein